MQELQYHIEQSRHLGQQVPGPKSAALDERRKNALPAGMAPSLPGYVVDADGGILADADGNRFIDLASGIAVTSAGASNLHPHLLHHFPVRVLRGRGRKTQRGHPG